MDGDGDDSPGLKAGASRFMAVACSPSAPRRLRPSLSVFLTRQRPLQDIMGGVDIPIVRDPALRARPRPIGQGEISLAVRTSVRGAILARIAGIYQHDTATGPFSLVRRDLHELMPSGIGDALR